MSGLLYSLYLKIKLNNCIHYSNAMCCCLHFHIFLLPDPKLRVKVLYVAQNETLSQQNHVKVETRNDYETGFYFRIRDEFQNKSTNNNQNNPELCPKVVPYTGQPFVLHSLNPIMYCNYNQCTLNRLTVCITAARSHEKKKKNKIFPQALKVSQQQQQNQLCDQQKFMILTRFVHQDHFQRLT